MKQGEWEQLLDARRGTPLCDLAPGIPMFKYQHVERMGSPDVDGILDGDVVVMNKLDGSNLSVAKGIVASRNVVISRDGNPKTGLKGAVEYVLAHAGIQSLMEARRWILRGEWARRHSLTYDKSTYGHFYVFDIQTWDGHYIHPDVYIPVLKTYRIRYIPVLKKLHRPSMDELTALSQGPDEFGADQKEGVVIKRYDFVSQYDRTVWGKIVSAEFKVKNKLTFHVSKKDDLELRFAQAVDARLVLKVIHKIEDVKDNKITEISEEFHDFLKQTKTPLMATVKDMSQILGRVWYDIIQEELWYFLKREKVDVFSFKKARKYVEVAAREIALAYFNGTLEEESC